MKLVTGDKMDNAWTAEAFSQLPKHLRDKCAAAFRAGRMETLNDQKAAREAKK